jgi:hypothetical protein
MVSRSLQFAPESSLLEGDKEIVDLRLMHLETRFLLFKVQEDLKSL